MVNQDDKPTIEVDAEASEAGSGESTGQSVAEAAPHDLALRAAEESASDAPAPGDPETVAPSPEEQLADLREQLEQAEAKAQRHWDLFLHARADLDNVRRRSERDLENAHKFALDKFAAELVGVKDSLEMGLSAATEQGADATKLVEGTELTLKMLSSIFAKFGISEVNPQGERFDPAHHEAMAMQPSRDSSPNTVLQVVQKGYLLNNRLLRPAMVIVAQAADS
jgi:molecular chaperone GrpE